jgi:hypothetical protein
VSLREDWPVQEKGSTHQSAAPVDVVDGPFVPQSDTRVALVIQAPQTNRVTLSWGGAAVLDQGITLYPGGAALVLNLWAHGAMVRGPIRAVGAVALQSLTYVEVINTAP